MQSLIKLFVYTLFFLYTVISQIQTIVHSSYSYDPRELNEHHLLLHQYLLEVSLGNLQESFKGFVGKTFFPLSTSNFYILFYIFFR